MNIDIKTENDLLSLIGSNDTIKDILEYMIRPGIETMNICKTFSIHKWYIHKHPIQDQERHKYLEGKTYIGIHWSGTYERLVMDRCYKKYITETIDVRPATVLLSDFLSYYREIQLNKVLSLDLEVSNDYE